MHSGARWAMRCRPGKLSWLAVYLALLGSAQAALAGPQEQSGGFSFPVRHEGLGAFAVPSVPVELVPPAFQEGVRRVLAQPTLAARGPAETFACDPAMYHWLLDNPHHAVHLWKQLGAKTTDVEVRGQGRFGYRDSNGTDIWWETVLNGGGLRVWYS